MADKTIGDYSAANSIDPDNDYYLLEQGGVYKKINRNVGLGLSSAPLGTTDSQSPQNKTFDNTTSLTIKDGSLTIQNSSSTTKQAIFSNASITAGQTRTFTFPDLSGTLVTASGSQTLTNKILTSPTISGGSIDNSTITVDSISGHTSGTLVTVANLQISNGVLNSANAVTATSIANGAVQPQALVTGTGSGWNWQSWTPTWTNLTIGNATQSAKYIQTGKTVFYNIEVVLGSTSSVSTDPIFSLPITSVSGYYVVFSIIGTVVMEDTGAAAYQGAVVWGSTTTAYLKNNRDSSSNTTLAQVTSTVPYTFTTGSKLHIQGFYQAA